MANRCIQVEKGICCDQNVTGNTVGARAVRRDIVGARRRHEEGRRPAGGRRHHELDARRLAARTPARLVDDDGRTPRRRRAGKLERLEQRRHRPLGARRAELHAGEGGRQDRHLEGDRDQRVVPDFAPVLGVAGQAGRAEEPALIHQLDAAHELRVGRRQRPLPEEALRSAAGEPAVPRDAVFGRLRPDQAVGAADDGRPRSQPEGGRDVDADRHRRELRRDHAPVRRLPEDAAELHAVAVERSARDLAQRRRHVARVVGQAAFG